METVLESLTPDFDAWRQPMDPEDAAEQDFCASTRAWAALIECRQDGLIAAVADDVCNDAICVEDAADEVVGCWERAHSPLSIGAWRLLRILLRAEILMISVFSGRPEGGGA